MSCISDAPPQHYLNPAFKHDDNVINSLHAEPADEYAITVRHAQIQYRDVVGALISGAVPTTNVVLKDFNMSAQKGHIYGLLGASGCGKTSILRAIMGQVELTAGEIRVFGHKPKTPESGIPGTTVGYMPQELSLMNEFTIKELLSFYGHISGMSFQEIDDRCNYLVKLLDLPKTNRIVGTLSGGQQRRVSFAIALIHSPPILILDEPTVGVDPLLRESIWKYLRKVTKTNGTTVLITTHYIEEASNADTVGLMRHGNLMAEQSPQYLKDSLSCSNLEDVLVKLCLLQSTKEQSTSFVNAAIELPDLRKVDDGEVKNSQTTTFVRKNVSSIQRVSALSWKNVISLLRHHWFLMMIVIYPATYMLFFCLTFGQTPYNLKISVLNRETNCFSDRLLWLNQNGYGNSTNCKIPRFLSCRILEELKKRGILPVQSESESAATNDVRTGRAWGALTFPKNFTSALLTRAAWTSPRDAEDDVFNMGSVQVTMDNSDQIVSNYVKEGLLNALKQVLRDINDICHNFRHMKDLPIQFKTAIYGGPNTNYIDTAVPGLVCGLSMLTPLTAALSTLLPEKISGSLERGLAAGVRMSEVILAHFIVGFVTSCASAALTVIVPYVLFGLVMKGSFWTIIIILVPLDICGLLFGYLLAVLSNTVTAASLVGFGFYFTCLFSSGFTWPVEAIYRYVRPLCWMLPMTSPTDAVRAAAIRGWSLYNKPVQFALTSSVLWACVLLVLLLILFRR